MREFLHYFSLHCNWQRWLILFYFVLAYYWSEVNPYVTDKWFVWTCTVENSIAMQGEQSLCIDSSISMFISSVIFHNYVCYCLIIHLKTAYFVLYFLEKCWFIFINVTTVYNNAVDEQRNMCKSYLLNFMKNGIIIFFSKKNSYIHIWM